MIILWRTTTRCNYACGFCAYDRRVAIPRFEVPEAEAIRFGELLASWAGARSERVLLSWIGGEPLLWRPVWALSSRLARAGLAISATTNGSSLHREEVRQAILSDFAELTVSVDAFAPVHDKLRGRAGAWDRVRNGIVALIQARRAARPRLRANIVLMRETIGSFADLCLTLADWGVDEITFNQLGGRDRPEFFPPQALQPGDIDRLEGMLAPLRATLRARGVTLCGDALYLRRLRASAADEPLPISDCRPGEAFLFVDEHGLASPCSFSSQGYGVPIAGLRNPADLDGLPQRFAAARAAQPLAVCGDCPSTQAFAKFAA